MRFHVRFEVFETITAPADITRVRQGVGKVISRIAASGKLELGGALGAKRSGFFVLKDIDDPAQLFDLLGTEILDACHVEALPILSFEQLGEVFRKNPVTN